MMTYFPAKISVPTRLQPRLDLRAARLQERRQRMILRLVRGAKRDVMHMKFGGETAIRHRATGWGNDPRPDCIP